MQGHCYKVVVTSDDFGNDDLTFCDLCIANALSHIGSYDEIITTKQENTGINPS